MGVDRDAIGVAQDWVVHHLDPVMNGQNGPFVPDNAAEVTTDILNLLYDVRGTIVDFAPDGQTVNVVRAVFPHRIDERADLVFDLGEAGGTLSSLLSRIRVPLCELGLTLERELAIVPSDFVPSVNGNPWSSEGKLTNPDANEDGKSVLLGGSGSVIIRSACVKRVYPNP